MSREEELRLAKRFKEAGDLDAVTELILSHLRLAVSIAMEYQRLPFPIMDLIQKGNVGLMHAVKKYDLYKGARVATYAAWWIRAYILKYILQNWRLVGIGTTETQRKLVFQLSKEREALEKLVVVASPKLLADQLNVKETEVIEMTQRLSEWHLYGRSNGSDYLYPWRWDELSDHTVLSHHVYGLQGEGNPFRTARWSASDRKVVIEKMAR